MQHDPYPNAGVRHTRFEVHGRPRGLLHGSARRRRDSSHGTRDGRDDVREAAWPRVRDGGHGCQGLLHFIDGREAARDAEVGGHAELLAEHLDVAGVGTQPPVLRHVVPRDVFVDVRHLDAHRGLPENAVILLLPEGVDVDLELSNGDGGAASRGLRRGSPAWGPAPRRRRGALQNCE